MKGLKIALERVVHESPVHGPVLVAEYQRVREIARMEELERCDPNGTWYDVAQAALGKVAAFEQAEAKRAHEIAAVLLGGPSRVDVAEAHRENAERDLKAAREKLQVAEQAIEVKQPGFDMYYHQLFAKEMEARKRVERELAEVRAYVKRANEQLGIPSDNAHRLASKIDALVARLKLCDDGTPDARGKFRVLEAEAKAAALEAQVRALTERIYTAEDFADAVALARPGRLLPLDDEGRLSPQGITVLVHSICALAAALRGAGRLLAEWRPIGWVDHACRQCRPQGEIVKEGFVCAYHAAVAAGVQPTT
jgi:hypothetical protein